MRKYRRLQSCLNLEVIVSVSTSSSSNNTISKIFRLIAALNLCFDNERILRGIQFHTLEPEQENDLILCCVLEFCMAKVLA